MGQCEAPGPSIGREKDKSERSFSRAQSMTTQSVASVCWTCLLSFWDKYWTFRVAVVMESLVLFVWANW